VPGIDPHRHWRNVLTGESVVFTVEDGQPALVMANLLAHFPVALLVAQPEAG
jgi:maltooligosyltrehalose synthase